MTEQTARVLLSNYITKTHPKRPFVIGKRIYKLFHPVSGIEFDADENTLYFVAYPRGVPEHKRDEYGQLWAVGHDGEVFLPEA